VARLLDRVRVQGGGVLLAEQAGWRLDGAVDRWQVCEDGRLSPGGPPAAPKLQPPSHAPGADIPLKARHLTVRRGSRPLLEAIDLQLAAGEIVLISGPNGAGKSTLSEILCGFRKPEAGSVFRRAEVSLMMPTSELQLFAPTVAAEVRSREDRGAAARVLRRHRLEHLAARPPWTLSRGERQRLVHAALDLQQPAVMIVDEPAQGLGPDDLQRFVELVHRRAERGRAYLIISHREELASAVHRHLRIENRGLVPC
jgi:energy-coupling factor transport system ATP-binding protein